MRADNKTKVELIKDVVWHLRGTEQFQYNMKCLSVQLHRYRQPTHASFRPRNAMNHESSPELLGSGHLTRFNTC